MDVVFDNKELPVPYVQVAESIAPATSYDNKPEKTSDLVVAVNVSEENTSEQATIHEGVNEELDLPNIFTPNNDGLNDYLEIKSLGLTDFSLVVLDMNGKPVFQTNDPAFKWDGMSLANERVKDGNYLYYFTARNSVGMLISKSQSLSITTQR
jgi:gliding motility-associated-like protein